MLKAQRKSSESANAVLLEEEETPANIPGNEFFGGNRQKEELYDPVAEEAAIITVEEIYNKFDDTSAFDGPIAKSVAQSLQHVINTILYEEEKESDIAFEYDAGLTWESPFGKTTPLQELKKSLEFYNRLDVAIVSGKTVNDNTVELAWEISVAWPILWEPRVVVTGTSVVNLRDNKIVKQVDRLEQSRLAQYHCFASTSSLLGYLSHWHDAIGGTYATTKSKHWTLTKVISGIRNHAKAGV